MPTVLVKSSHGFNNFITGTATLCMALLPINLLGNYTPIAILILQMALSFSFAGEYPSLITYLFNNSKNNENSRLSAIINGSTAFGIIISLTVVFAFGIFFRTRDDAKYWMASSPVFRSA
ncbi:hypothetical protein AB6G20_12570 [Providencia hangzhouensis]|uniref:hypothetical protein n=1 Tax=Providencia hangzhouensis TaxID=3031799 RepID=UPI0034DDBA7A